VDPSSLAALAGTWLRSARPLAQALGTTRVTVNGLRVEIPFPRPIRLSIVAGNIRVQHLIDASVGPGDRVVDVGAHIGLNTLYMAARVGPSGHVTAIEPAPDNVAVLRRNLAANHLQTVTLRAVAAGRGHGPRDFFLRGAVSAVNSLFAESIYAEVSEVARITVAPLDDLVEGTPRLVKIDVEGAELDVLAGMTRLLRAPDIRLIVEWHPLLQEAAGYSAEALPRTLWEAGFDLHAASHARVSRLAPNDLPDLIGRLRRGRHPVELLAVRAQVASRSGSNAAWSAPSPSPQPPAPSSQ
jgi:FkbM family methyltransferase